MRIKTLSHPYSSVFQGVREIDVDLSQLRDIKRVNLHPDADHTLGIELRFTGRHYTETAEYNEDLWEKLSEQVTQNQLEDPATLRKP